MARDEVVYVPGVSGNCQKEECLIQVSGNLVQIYSQPKPSNQPDPMARKLSAYYKALRRHLLCSKEDKDRFVHEATQAVAEYRGEHPRSEFSDIVQAFGEPRNWAREIMADRLDPSVVQAYKQRRKRICRLFLAGSLALVLALGCISIYLYQMKMNVVVTQKTTLIVKEID